MAASTTLLALGDGTAEVVGFFGELFGVTHLPAGEPTGRVLICSPVYSEFLKNNRREVLLGRRLATHGFAVQRFHYRGTGNSRGVDSQLTLESMRHDAADALAHLLERTGEGTVDIVSTRLASLAAAPLQSEQGRAVMWEPVTDGKRYFRDLARAVLILGVKHGGGRGPRDIEEEWMSTGALDIAGFSVARSLRDSTAGAGLEVPQGTGEMLLAQVGLSGEIRREVAEAATVGESAGRPVSTTRVAGEEAWWFHQDVDLLRPEEGAALDAALVELTSSWLRRW